jgi:hypothetical protein
MFPVKSTMETILGNITTEQQLDRMILNIFPEDIYGVNFAAAEIIHTIKENPERQNPDYINFASRILLLAGENGYSNLVQFASPLWKMNPETKKASGKDFMHPLNLIHLARHLSKLNLSIWGIRAWHIMAEIGEEEKLGYTPFDLQINDDESVGKVENAYQLIQTTDISAIGTYRLTKILTSFNQKRKNHSGPDSFEFTNHRIENHYSWAENNPENIVFYPDFEFYKVILEIPPYKILDPDLQPDKFDTAKENLQFVRKMTKRRFDEKFSEPVQNAFPGYNLENIFHFF